MMNRVLFTPREYTVFLGLVAQSVVPKTWYKVISQDYEIVELEFSPVVNVALSFHIGKLFAHEELRQKTGL